MDYKDFKKQFWKKTTIQEEEILNKSIGIEIEIKACIEDIKKNRIDIKEITNEWNYDSGYPNDLYGFDLYYDKEKFGKELLTYQHNIDINAKAKLIGGHVTKDGIMKYKLELVSISKIGTTYESRCNALSKKKNGGCFIATACYGNYDAPEVLVLRQFRDEILLQSFFGKLFVSLYYSVSPFFAAQIAKSDWLKKAVKGYFIEPIVKRVGRNK